MGDLENTLITDLSEEDSKDLQMYISNGKPGSSKIRDDDVIRWFGLYMSGKSYSEIAKLEGIHRNVVMYFSSQLNWCDKKMDHFTDLISNETKKLTQVKLETTNTLNTTISAMNKYFGEKFNKYLQTGDKAVMEEVDTKLLVQYYKAVDTLSKLTAPVKMSDSGSINPNPTPGININLNGETTIQSPDGQIVEITPKNSGEVLKSMAEAKKIREKQ